MTIRIHAEKYLKKFNINLLFFKKALAYILGIDKNFWNLIKTLQNNSESKHHS